jgi:polar amino acid transport system substrate-binding protein
MSWAAITGFVLPPLLLLLLVAVVVIGIANLTHRRRALKIIGALVFAGFIACWVVFPQLLPGGHDYALWVPVPMFLLLVGIVVLTALNDELWHRSQWVALGAGMLIAVSGFVPPWLPGYVRSDSTALWSDAGWILWMAGMLTMLFAPKLVSAVLRSRAPGAESFWHPSQWSGNDFLNLVILLYVLAMPVALPWVSGLPLPLFMAIVLSPLGVVAIYAILKFRLWHPSQWSAYRAGLLAVAIAVILFSLSQPRGGQPADSTGQIVVVLLLCAGAVLSLYRHFWHPAQWLAAGVGAALVVAGALMARRGWANADQTMAAFCGLMILLFGPRLITWYVRDHPQQVDQLGKRLLSGDETIHPWGRLAMRTLRSELAPTGVLRAGLNLANFLLITGKDADGTLTGVGPDMAAEIARRLGVPVRYVPFNTPAELIEAAEAGAWDIALIGPEPQRDEKIAFTPAYVEIGATYLVPAGSPIQSIADVDKPGVRIAVTERSAYAHWLDSNIEHATLVKTDTLDGAYETFVAEKLEVLAGVRPRLLGDLEKLPGARILDGRFTAMQQAIGTAWSKKRVVTTFLRLVVEEAKASGFVQDLIDRHYVRGLAVAPPDGAITTRPLWHPSRWSAYRVGLLAVPGSVIVVLLAGGAMSLEGVVGTGAVIAGIFLFLVATLLFLAGLILTLYGNLRNPRQWLSAAAGFAAIAGAFVLPQSYQGLLLLAGLLMILFGPRYFAADRVAIRKRIEPARLDHHLVPGR